MDDLNRRAGKLFDVRISNMRSCVFRSAVTALLFLSQGPLSHGPLLGQDPDNAAATSSEAASPVVQEAIQPLPKRTVDVGVRKDLDGHFPMQVPESVQQWERRREELKNQLKVALGLSPMPTMPPLRPVVHGLVQRDNYTVEKVYFEALPGLYVTGSLYKPYPLEPDKKYPAVLSPHGHWNDGRFYEASDKEARLALANGAERFESAAKFPLQARCVQLARMGCFVFHWDMLGYADSLQISYERAHRFAKQERELEANTDGWLLFSPEAESHSQSVLGIQTIHGIRSVDFVLQLPQVDSSRIAITGASGGGTQSFLTAAMDDRISVAFPAVMVSTGMQGGCTCENASGLRIGTGNIEIAGLIAPRPLGMTAADDWTKTMPQDGFPELKKLYTLLGQPNNVSLFPALHYGHNYNHVSRVAMYGWMNQFLGLKQQAPVLESDFVPLTKGEMSVWNAEHPVPESGVEFERKLLKNWATDIQTQLAGGLSEVGQSSRDMLSTLRNGWAAVIGNEAEVIDWNSQSTGGASEIGLRRGTVVGMPNVSGDSEIVSLGPIGPKKVAILLSAHGLADWDEEQSSTRQMAGTLAQAGWLAVGLNIPGNELLSDLQSPDLLEQMLVTNPRLAASYTYGYNRSVAAIRSHKLARFIEALRADGGAELAIFAEGELAAVAAGAAFLRPAQVQHLVLSDTGFRFSQVDSIRDIDFLPGASRYLDLPGLVAAVDGPQVVVRTAEEFAKDWSIVPKVYEQSTSEARFKMIPVNHAVDPTMDWLKTWIKQVD